ncbi:RICIN domain-containing protein [Phytomonospora sp. NPDC050363]|uniref:rhamnogalacturonan lyase family protein n=1 Tax=Phytomonospora sp. NPDC050363 TaxID=3155642 RepID=UPI0033C968E7
MMMSGTPCPRSLLTRLLAAVTVALTVVAGLVVAAPPPASAAVIDPSAYYVLVSRLNGLVFDITGGSTADGATLQQWGRADAAHQQFQFVDSGGGYYRLKARHSGKVLEVWDWSTADGATVGQWSDLNGANQQFQVVDTDSGYVKFINRNSGKALDVWEWSTAHGGRISQFADTGAANQQWALVPVTAAPSGRQLEALDRGVVSVRSGSGNLVTWRLLASDPSGVAFNVYRAGTKVNSSPLTGATNLLDSGAAAGAAYTVRAVVGGVEQPDSPAALQFGSGYLDVPLQIPSGGTTPSGESYTYSANDASVGDLDGDGRLEFVVKWDPSNAKDNSQSGYTGNVYVDAYRINGQRLWRINLGRNIRAGAHYTQFQVYDYSGDGRAEVAMKTADATVDGAGGVIGSSSADYRNSSGYVLSGPEYLTMFDGATGRALSTVSYLPARGNVADWGDSYGNRVDRFLAGTAYLDGQRPSLIMSRGYYTRAVIVAWDFRNGSLTRRWTFDSNSAGSQYRGQGNHNLSIADVDADGRDEIVFGAMCVNDDGSALWNTGNGHGDALHVGDLDPSRPGLEVFDVAEDASKPSSWFGNARTGAFYWSTPAAGDNGRGVSANIYAGSPGAESWSSAVSNLRSPTGGDVGRKPSSANFLLWWDGDTVRELLDATHVDKYGTSGDTRLLTGSGVAANNGTKATPAISGDLFGDWREEVVWRTSNSSALRIYSTPIQTGTRLTTLLHDTQYRVALAWQNTAYNQPPHPSFFL